MDSNSDGGGFKCSKCPKSLATKENLKKHFNEVHIAIPKFKCEHCPREFKRRADLSLHVRGIHEKDPELYCNECNKGFNKKSNFKLHKQVRHRRDDFIPRDVDNDNAVNAVNAVNVSEPICFNFDNRRNRIYETFKEEGCDEGQLFIIDLYGDSVADDCNDIAIDKNGSMDCKRKSSPADNLEHNKTPNGKRRKTLPPLIPLD